MKYIGVKIIEAVPMTADEYMDQVRPLHYSGEDRDGYKVIYPDGYESWSPKSVFDEAYRPTDGMTYGLANEAALKGAKIIREGWNGKGFWVKAQIPDEHSKMTLPYLYIEYPEGHIAYPKGCRVPWIPSQTDNMATDWRIIE